MKYLVALAILIVSISAWNKIEEASDCRKCRMDLNRVCQSNGGSYCCNKEEDGHECMSQFGTTCSESLDLYNGPGSRYILCPSFSPCTTSIDASSAGENLADVSLGDDLYCLTTVNYQDDVYPFEIQFTDFAIGQAEIDVYRRRPETGYERLGLIGKGTYLIREKSEQLILVAGGKYRP